MGKRRIAPPKVLTVAFLAAIGLLAHPAPSLAAEGAPTPPLTTVATAPAGPGATTGDDPDDEPSGGGWRGWDDGSDSSDADDEFADAESADQQKASKKKQSSKQAGQKSSKKSSKATKKKAAKKAARRKARAQAKMRRQAMKAARAAARERAQQQRRARSDDGDSGGSIDSMRQAILDLTNRARASAGCGRLRYSTQLERSAQAHANDMSEHRYMAHTSRSGRNFDQRIRSTGFHGDKTGENLGNGFSSPEAVFKAWMSSPSHRRNIVDCKFKILGVGYARSGGYWVQHFGG